MIPTILSIISALLTLYTILCFASVIMTWIPGAKFTKVGKIISSICDPYMNFFSKKGLFRFGSIDFSPILSLGLLSLLSTIIGGIQSTGRIYIGGILRTILFSLWGIVQSLVGLLFLLILIRWIALLFSHGVTPYDSIWTRFDQMLNRFVYKISGTFYRRPINYQNALLISWIVLIVFELTGTILVNVLASLCTKLPF